MLRMSVVASLAAAMLAGCVMDGSEAKARLANLPKVQVLGPGFEIAVRRLPVKVMGTQPCDLTGHRVWTQVGEMPRQGANDCVVIGPETKAVNVVVMVDGKARPDQWALTRDPDTGQLSMMRPDGERIVTYAEFLQANAQAMDLRRVTHIKDGQ